MAYGDSPDPVGRVIAVVLVAGFTVLLGYGMIVGLNIEVVKKVKEKMDVFDIEEPPEPEPPEEEPPPPPPEPIDIPPPPVIDIPTPPPIAPVISRNVAPPPPKAEPPPPPDLSRPPKPKGRPARWASTRDYPSRALRRELEGTVRFQVTINEKGRVSSCTITRSSGHDILDEATCKLITRRGRFEPGRDRNGNLGGTWASAVRWQIPQ